MTHPDWMGSCQKKTRVCTDGNEWGENSAYHASCDGVERNFVKTGGRPVI